MNRLQRRKLTSALALGFAGLATLIGLFFLGAILWTLVSKGIAGVAAANFPPNTPPPRSSHGTLHTIYGSLLMTAIGLGFGAPIGILAGTYLAEYGRGKTLSAVVRFVNDVLLSAPSIIVGLFVYELLVVRMGHFSAIAGAVALAVIAIPVTVRTTEDMLNLIPQGMKDASTALGVQHWRTVTAVIYPAARSGIITGLLLAVARISGETAPLLFTALNNQFWSNDLNAPMANLPVVIFQFALSPYEDWQQLAWTGALLITVTILLLSIAARSIVTSVKANR